MALASPLFAILATSGVLLPACARADVDGAALDAYAKARLADEDGATDIALSNYRLAMAAAPDNGLIAIRSYRQAIESGDWALALRSANILDAANMLPHDATLLLAVDALGRKDWKRARAIADRLEAEGNFAFVAPILISWASLGEGQFAPPSVDASSRYGALARRYVDECVAWQLLTQGKVALALPSVKRALAMTTKPQAGSRIAFARRIATLGERDAALALIPGEMSLFARTRHAIATGGHLDAPALTPQQGFARLMARLSDDLAGEGTRMLSLTLARLASFGDPSSAEFHLAVATRLQAADRATLALVEAEKVSPDGLYGLAAADARIDALVALGRHDEALDLARKLATSSDAGPGQYLRLASLYVDERDFDAAVDAYHMARNSYPEDAVPWSIYLLEGSALERGGHWTEAKAALLKAKALAPEEPVILNYLGYAEVERRDDVNEALALLQKASALRPDDPSITDSLGWAYYVSGDAAEAVPVLERAAAASPADVTINEHLGDAYWAVGRRFEARYAWRAARVSAEGDDATRLTAKVRDGLVVAGSD